MLARIPDLAYSKLIRIALLLCLVTALTSCATKQPPLIADPAGTRDSALPWNEQQQWERDGSAAGLNMAGRR
jgi:hypothetical protein